MESDPEEHNESDQEDSIPRSKSKDSPNDNEESDASHGPSEDGDDEEDVSERDEELMNLDPKALKNKIVAEVCQIPKHVFPI